ncbi:unnamed protein product [Cuscuta campestris]|uniref:Acyl-[acyl-carrier-protein] hydrolase n=1 Tax=Cuscuta campestris TaxID=132261 RepID=A0A484KGR6_9ASTE|nr:unnamed protein product [Cuscuta campestris]
MVATAATAAFFPGTQVALESGVKTVRSKFGATVSSNKVSESIKLRSSSSRNVQVVGNAQVPTKVNGAVVGVMDGVDKDDDELMSSSPSKTFINQLPDWSMLLAAMTTIFLAAEKQWMMLDWKPKRPDYLIDAFGLGRIMEGGFFRQTFSIRSYEIGADKTASIEAMMNHLQETALNHVKTAGIMSDGFGTTQAMCKKKLIWVVSKMQVLMDRYPVWGDLVQVDTWVCAAGKHGMRRDWVFSDSHTGETLMRATSVWVMMSQETRRLAKMPDDVRAEIERHFVDREPIIDDDKRKLPKLNKETADCILAGLTPKWSDLDVNQHVNNVKYVGWMLESVPLSILENNELAAMTLEYRRECGRDSVLESMTSVLGNISDSVECQHLLCLDNGEEIVKGRTMWTPKLAKKTGTVDQLEGQSH